MKFQVAATQHGEGGKWVAKVTCSEGAWEGVAEAMTTEAAVTKARHDLAAKVRKYIRELERLAAAAEPPGGD
jgi:hypothetical protein